VQVAPWVTRDALPAGLPGGEAELDAACELASAVLFGLSGRRWAGHATKTIQVFAERTRWWWGLGESGLPWDASWGFCGVSTPAVPVLVGGDLFNHSACDRPRTIRLPDYPVRAVTAVRVGGQVRDALSYRLVGNRYLEDTWDGWVVCGGDTPMEVDYAYGADPPAAGKAAAARLAAELSRALGNQPSALPGYVYQRVRQGVTESFVRTDSLFDKGRTGLADVDLWLATVNPAGLRRRARSWSPDTDPHYRTLTTGGTTP
jgi:hypothetical protein